jgi:hypothetical protein
MTPKVRIQTSSGVVNYMDYPKHRMTNLVGLKHLLRVKQVLYGEIFTFYHKDMNFSNSVILHHTL